MNNNLQKYETSFSPKESSKLNMFGYKDWRITEFVRSLTSSNLQYVIQPLVRITEEKEGFTGLTAYTITHEELINNFNINKED